MFFNIGDLVTRNSYGNDIVFKIIEIRENIIYLKGINVRLLADSEISDLSKVENNRVENDEEITTLLDDDIRLDRSKYFYLPGKVLHIDSDKEYLNRCLKLYKKLKIVAFGILLDEDKVEENIIEYLNNINPDIVVITGHDAYLKNKRNKISREDYKNSNFFIKSVIKARKYEKSHEKLIIIAGACQSNYEELIKSGANFASSPKRVNIHALDPAIIASLIALSDRNENIDLLKIINKTKYKEEGIGGIITTGTMYVGYPRWI